MSVGITSIPGFNYTLFFGYVAIPEDLDRETYIRDCYLNNQISVIIETGGFLNRVPVSQEVLNFITFPTEPKKFGSPLLLGTDDVYKHCVVIARLHGRDELGDGKEHQFKFKKVVDGKLVEISGSATDGALNIAVSGDDKPGQLNINLFSQKKDCQFNVNIAGNGTITTTDNFTFNQNGSFVVETEDAEEDNVSSKFEQTSRENHFKNEKLVVNGGDDPLVLGNELKDFLGEFIDQVASITVATAIGTQPILNKVQVTALKQKLDTILSKVIFTDK